MLSSWRHQLNSPVKVSGQNVHGKVIFPAGIFSAFDEHSSGLRREALPELLVMVLPAVWLFRLDDLRLRLCSMRARDMSRSLLLLKPVRGVEILLLV